MTRSEVRCWRLARDIREYVAEIRGVVNSAAAPLAWEGVLAESLRRAEAHANRIDPLTPLREKTSHGVALRDAILPDQEGSVAHETVTAPPAEGR